MAHETYSDNATAVRRHSENFDQSGAAHLQHWRGAGQRQSWRRRATTLPTFALLLKYKVLFLEDQEITRAEHVAFARRFGELEDHPVMASDRDHPGLVLIYKVRHARRAVRERLPLRHDVARVPAVRRCTALYRGA